MWKFLSNLFWGCVPKDEGLGIYRGWVDDSLDGRDLTVATRDGVGLGQGVVSRRILDSKKAALQALVPPREKRIPFYKDAHEKAGLHDKRLGEIEVELRLQYEKLDDLRPPKEVCIVKRFYGVVLLCLVSRNYRKITGDKFSCYVGLIRNVDG
jgi:sentrin-specific protease 1